MDGRAPGTSELSGRAAGTTAWGWIQILALVGVLTALTPLTPLVGGYMARV
jgi:hypothetical protein